MTGPFGIFCTPFLHYLDTATIQHCDISALNHINLMSHKDFQTELLPQLCRQGQQKSIDHMLTAIAMVPGSEPESHKGPAH